MALANIKKNFAAAIEDTQAPVIALSGNWGTGKSYMWDQYKKSSPSVAVQKAIYVSLFGVRTIHALKMKLLAASAENPDGGNRFGTTMTGSVGALAKVIKGLHRSAEAIDDIALLTLPYVLRDAFVVLDDIERKHSQLEIDEVLGFLDEFSVKHETRFLMILNTDKLGDKEIWEKFREKVIHYEIALEITPDEAFDIANKNNSTVYATAIKRANQIIGVCNIRVLSKMIVFVERIFKNHTDIEDKVQERLVSAAVLLCAIHYKVLPDGPTLDYVFGFKGMMEPVSTEKKDEGTVLRRWSDLMHRLRLFQSSEFEREVADALRTGVFEYGKLDRAIHNYRSPLQVNLAAERVSDFVHDYTWDHKKSVADLSNEANLMLDLVPHMDVDTITALWTIVLRIDRPDLGNALVQHWLSTHRFTPEAASNMLSSNGSRYFPSEIVEQLRITANQMMHLSRDLIDVVLRIRRNYYSDNDERIIATSNIEQYIQALRDSHKENFVEFVGVHMDWIHYQEKRGWKVAGLQNFVEACARIVEEEPTSRLADVLHRRVFGAATDLRSILSWTANTNEAPG